MTTASSTTVAKCASSEEQANDSPFIFTCHVFFDGTNNNIVNVARREEVQRHDKGLMHGPLRPGQRELAAEADSSYRNDRSNVGELFVRVAPVELASSEEASVSIYIEGIGTSSDEEDSTYVGGGLGLGSTGIVQRVSDALHLVRRELIDRAPSEVVSGDRPVEVRMTVWGFSRGAAAARHCVHLALVVGLPVFVAVDPHGNPVYQRFLLSRFVERGSTIRVRAVVVLFAGLFDTVASHGLRHVNDVATLGLASISRAQKVLHLTASDEFRDNFALSNISVAVADGVGTEIALPGAHSDIGGGYVDNVLEDVIVSDLPVDTMLSAARAGAVLGGPLLAATAGRSLRERQASLWERRLAEDRQWFERMGYAPRGAVSVSQEDDAEGQDVAWISQDSRLRLRRRSLANGYARIPLHLMHRHARVTVGIPLRSAMLLPAIPPSLVEVNRHIVQYAERTFAGTRSSASDWHPGEPWVRAIRQHYLHLSAHYRRTFGLFAPMQPSFLLDGELGTSGDHRMRGTRSRRVLKG